MHIGGLTIVEGPPPPTSELLEQIRLRLHLVPRYRHKLANTALDSGRPVWVDDPNFNLEYHIRHTALPTPGGWEQLCSLTARIFSQQLDRSKPLWEMWLIEGLEDDRFALITKTHHSLIDGIAGVDLATVLFDLSPDPPPIRHSGRAWQPHREPGTVELIAAGIRGRGARGLRACRRRRGGAGAPRPCARASARSRRGDRGDPVGGAESGAGNAAQRADRPASALLRDPLCARRLQDGQERVRRHRQRRGARRCDRRDEVVADLARSAHRGLELRALVPVSVRVEDERGEAGNRLVVMRGPLPVYIADPVARLRFVSHAMDGLKESKQALGAEVISSVQNFAPPTLLAQASRLNFSTRLFNLIVTNIPGPQFPLYVLGREMLEAYPVAFLPENHSLAIAIMSYNGQMNFGLLGDFDALPDIDEISANISDELQTLLALARKPVAATA